MLPVCDSSSDAYDRSTLRRLNAVRSSSSDAPHAARCAHRQDITVSMNEGLRLAAAAMCSGRRTATRSTATIVLNLQLIGANIVRTHSIIITLMSYF